MLVEAVLCFLGVALVLYCVLGGADFGAGIIELLTSNSTERNEIRALVTRAMGPVWEANHVWLILVVVILFNGFPQAFSALCITFHIPLTLMLVGIVLRGCAFTFRHYDAVRDGSQRYYTIIFNLSSVLVPLMLGAVVGALTLRKPWPVSGDFYNSFVPPWCNLTSIAVGVFCCALFAFLAAVYLVGEAGHGALRDLLVRLAVLLNVAAIVLGATVFGASQYQGTPLLSEFIATPVSLGCLVAASFALVPLWMGVLRASVGWTRSSAAAVVAFVMIGWIGLIFPDVMGEGTTHVPKAISLADTAAPEAVLRALLAALIGGSVLIFPAFFYLLKIFKLKPSSR